MGSGSGAASRGGMKMTSAPNSMLYSFLLFLITLSAQQMYKEKLASSELFTVFGGFISSLLFVLCLTMIGNFQETTGTRTSWGTVILAELIACTAAGFVHRVCVTTCVLFSAVLLYEVNKISSSMHQQPETASTSSLASSVSLSNKKKAH